MTPEHPLQQLITAQQQARSNDDPSAKYCTLTTLENSDPSQPRSRTVVARDINHEGCLIFINRDSEKNLASPYDTKLELMFFYPSLMRQFRVRGSLQLMSTEQLEARWQHKPYRSKLLDHFYQDIQPQSSVLTNTQSLIKGLETLSKRYDKPETVPLSHNALGVWVIAHYVELWCLGEDGVHERTLFHRIDGDWSSNPLVP